MTCNLWLNGADAGPYIISQIRSMRNRGLITMQTMYWRERMSTWKPIGEIVARIEGKDVQIAKLKRNPKPSLIGSLLFLIALGLK